MQLEQGGGGRITGQVCEPRAASVPAPPNQGDPSPHPFPGIPRDPPEPLPAPFLVFLLSWGSL